MIDMIRDAVAFPFFIGACVFIWIDTCIQYGFSAANDLLVEIFESE